MKKYKGILVTFWFPPVNSVAGLRMRSLVEYLNIHENIRLEVICPEREGVNDLKEFCHYSHKQPNNVYYSHKTSNESLFQKLKSWILYDIIKIQIYLNIKRGEFFSKALEKLNDIDVDAYDFIICSHGPIDAFKVGSVIKDKYPDIKLIVDYRDHISYNPLHSYGIWSKLYLDFEKQILRKADLVVGVSKRLVLKLKNEIDFQASTQVVYNGYFASDQIFTAVNDTNIRPIISHTGALYGGKRSCDSFFKYYKENLEQDYQLQFAVLDFEDQKYLESCEKKYNLSDIKIISKLNHESSLELIRNSKYCLLALSESGIDEEYLPVKMYEYIQYEKPIIFCGNKNKSEAYELLRDYNCGDHFEDFAFDEKTEYEFSLAQEVFRRDTQANSLADAITGLFEIEGN